MNMFLKAGQMVSSELQKLKSVNLCNRQGPKKKQMAQSNRREPRGFIYKGSMYKGVGIGEAEGRGRGND